MAKEPKVKRKRKRGEGRTAQLWQVFQMTRRYDKSAIWWMLLAFAGPLAVLAAVGVWLAAGNWLVIVLWVILGITTGVLVSLIVLGRRAERAAYGQIEGQPGAVGAVLRAGIRGRWMTSEMPVGFTKQQDALYRAVGRGGVVLLSEGDRARTNKLVADETRKIQRVVPNVPITVFHVGTGENDVRLGSMVKRIKKTEKVLNKVEVVAIHNRLTSMQNTLPIPKGMDPTKVRMPRKRR